MTANSDLIIYQENELYGLKDCNDNVNPLAELI